MELIVAPHVVDKPAISYQGRRIVTPFRGMLAMRDVLLAEVQKESAGADPADLRFFLRLHTIDMKGEIDLSVGVITKGGILTNYQLDSAELPAGRYASLTYVNHAMRANRALLEWIAAEGLPKDVSIESDGDHFGSRYGLYPGNLFTQRRKTSWQVELNIKLAD